MKKIVILLLAFITASRLLGQSIYDPIIVNYEINHYTEVKWDRGLHSWVLDDSGKTQMVLCLTNYGDRQTAKVFQAGQLSQEVDINSQTPISLTKTVRYYGQDINVGGCFFQVLNVTKSECDIKIVDPEWITTYHVRRLLKSAAETSKELPKTESPKPMALSPIAQAPPFYGTKYFNFAGGAGTSQSLTITNDNHAVIKSYGRGGTFVDYDSIYSPIIKLKYGTIVRIGKTDISEIDEKGNLKFGCKTDGIPCTVQFDK